PVGAVGSLAGRRAGVGQSGGTGRRTPGTFRGGVRRSRSGAAVGPCPGGPRGDESVRGARGVARRSVRPGPTHPGPMPPVGRVGAGRRRTRAGPTGRARGRRTGGPCRGSGGVVGVDPNVPLRQITAVDGEGTVG